MKICICKECHENIRLIDLCITYSSVHGIPYIGKHFKYCPFCKKELKEVI